MCICDGQTRDNTRVKNKTQTERLMAKKCWGVTNGGAIQSATDSRSHTILHTRRCGVEEDSAEDGGTLLAMFKRPIKINKMHRATRTLRSWLSFNSVPINIR